MKHIFCHYILYTFVLFSLSFLSCQSADQPSSESGWSEIIIKLDGQMITISNNAKQSGWNRIYVPKDTVELISLTDDQLDSIYKYVNAIIDNPPVPDHFVTMEVAENVLFKIESSKEIARSTRTTTSKLIEFQYIESWKDLSAETKALSLILANNVRLLK